MTRNNPTCNNCGVVLTPLNWTKYSKAHWIYRCDDCERDRKSKWRKDHIEAARESGRLRSEKIRRQNGQRPMSENRKCASFLGIHVAEEVLSHVFKNVQRMPNNNHGYDFICGGGYKIDVKSSCRRVHEENWADNWEFYIGKNLIAEYFLCLAFDNRDGLNPEHVWLIPARYVNDHMTVGISETTLAKWDEYKLGTGKVISCCNSMKAST